MVKIKHDKCGYEWDYKGNMENPTCPNCNYKVFENKKTGDTNEDKTEQTDQV